MHFLVKNGSFSATFSHSIIKERVWRGFDVEVHIPLLSVPGLYRWPSDLAHGQRSGKRREQEGRKRERKGAEGQRTKWCGKEEGVARAAGLGKGGVRRRGHGRRGGNGRG